jgi:hypothetical protein
MARRLVVALALVAVGCDKGRESAPYLDVQIPETTDRSAGPNAFGAYANLAERAEDRAKLSLDTRDTPGNRRKALAELGPLLPELSAATHLPCTFLFEPVGPFDERPHQIGWLQLGRALVWRIEQAVEQGDWDDAAQWTVVATIFGADLGGGSMSDAALGYGVMDGARKAIAPYVATLPPSALRSLSDGVRRALGRLPDAGVTIENESALMLAAVKSMQSAHKSGKTDEFAARLFGESREAVKAFGALDGSERNAFVRSLLDEQASVVRQLLERSQSPGANRGLIESGLSGGARTIADQFFSAGMPWLAVRDLTVARTRLLYLTAQLCRSLDETGTSPSSLEGVPLSLRVDPYTGLSMGYVPLGQDFVVYSCGIDGKDDRGDTDSERMRPDLLLEEAAL